MKKNKLSAVLLVLLFSFIPGMSAQLHFGVSPGLQMNGAIFGYKHKKLVPFISLHVLSMNSSVTERVHRFDPDVDAIVAEEETYRVSGNIFMPSIGLKYFFNDTRKLKAYGNFSLTGFFLSAKISDPDDPEADEELKETLKNTRIYGGQLGFGTEYFFDNNFSIGGEFGLRIIHMNYKENFDDEVFDPNTGDTVPVTDTRTLRLNISPTYTKFSINFYFGAE